MGAPQSGSSPQSPAQERWPVDREGMTMQHKVKVTVIDKKCYPEIQQAYCADPSSGPCPCYHVGDTFLFERYGGTDHFWGMGLHTLQQPAEDAPHTAGGDAMPHCSEAWDAIARYIYTGLQGGAIMRGWMNDERVMIACCSDGTRPVIFKIERLDYKAVYLSGAEDESARTAVEAAFRALPGVTDVQRRAEWTEVFMDRDVPDADMARAAAECAGCGVIRID